MNSTLMYVLAFVAGVVLDELFGVRLVRKLDAVLIAAETRATTILARLEAATAAVEAQIAKETQKL
jgi:hypothetical protein